MDRPTFWQWQLKDGGEPIITRKSIFGPDLGDCLVLLWILTGPSSWAQVGTPPSPPSPGPQASAIVHAPLDLVWTTADPNGVPSDPQWWWQVVHPGTVPDVLQQCGGIPDSPACTTQKTTLDLATGQNRFICSLDLGTRIPGHVNWFPVTVTEALRWSDFAPDLDYNFATSPNDQEALTVANYGALGEEFDSRETIDHFRSRWWVALRQAVDSRDANAINALLNGQNNNQPPRTILLGLFGLDCPHACKSELHPLFVMAIEVNADPTDDTWMMFVRNWGDEGLCSHLQHFADFPSNQVRLLLPRPGAKHLLVTHQSRFFTNNVSSQWPIVDVVKGQGALAVFQLPPPEQRGFIEGELHLRWPGITHSLRQPTASRTQSAAAENDEPESYLQQALDRLPDERRRHFESAVRSLTSGDNSLRELLPALEQQIRSLNAVPPPLLPPSVRTATDDNKTVFDRWLFMTLCTAYRGEPEPEFCSNNRDTQ